MKTTPCRLHRAGFLYSHSVSDLSDYGLRKVFAVRPSTLRFCHASVRRRNAAISSPRAASPQVDRRLTSYASKCRRSVLCEAGGRPAVRTRQTPGILGMCKRSQFLAEGAERCQASAAGRGRGTGGVDTTRNMYTHATPAELKPRALEKKNQGQPESDFGE